MGVNPPSMSRIEVMEHIRTSDKLKSIPVMSLSKSALLPHVARSLDAAFLKYLTEPANMQKARYY